MLGSVFVFSSIYGTLVSYPHDYTHEIFTYAIKKSKNNVQIVLVRKDNLLHYCYVWKIKDKQFFGLCLRTNRIYNNVQDLFRVFDHTLSEIVTAGILMQIDTKGNVVVGTTDYAKEAVEINEQANRFIHSLKLSESTTQPLPAVDFSISINDCIEKSCLDTPNAVIIDAIKRYNNVYIVPTHNEIARLTEYTTLVKNKNKEIQQLQKQIEQKDKEISQKDKEKNKYRWVLILLAVIFIGSVVFYFHNNKQNNTIHHQGTKINGLNDSICHIQLELDSTISILTSTEEELGHANKKIQNLKTENDQLSNNLKQIESEFSDTKIELDNYKRDYTKLSEQQASLQFGIANIEICNKSIGGTIDIPYGEKIYANQSMYLGVRFKYHYILKEKQTISVVLKLFYPNGKIIYSSNSSDGQYTWKEDVVVKNGQNIYEFPRHIGGPNKGYYRAGQYRCELWANGIKVGEKIFTLY